LDSQPDKRDLASVEAARSFEPEIREPDDLAREELRNNHATRMHEMHAGYIGRFCGSGSEKSGNIAIVSIIFCFAVIGFGLFKFDLETQIDSFFKLLTAMLGLVALALGYLFGRGKSD
jgi:hypothetical protein